MNKSIRRSMNRRSKQHRTKHLHRRSKHSNRRKAIRSRKHTSNAVYMEKVFNTTADRVNRL
jgi:hypothetical protein